MKMLPEHVEHIRSTIADKFTTDELLLKARNYEECFLSPTRLACHLIRECELMPFRRHILCVYLDDVQIATALRRVMRKLGIPSWTVD